ncbi:MAG TPA: hypothetical protein VGL50_04505 [Steroidobacteraceae bacterium]|jgi:hypothetical protein
MSRLGLTVVIATLGLTGCSWMHRDRDSGAMTQQSGTSAQPQLQGSDKDTLKTGPTKQLPEQQQR